MSFKRDGDDKGLLNNLRKRRVKELLGEDIPEDEAKLLCNGRFACLVCQHNPVFDTVNMLMVHRQGKKHAANDVDFVRKKKELKNLILRRQHEQFMKDGTTNIRQAASPSVGGVLNSQPYDPCVKKRRVKPYDRKARLDLGPTPPPYPPSQPPSASSQAFSATVPRKHSHQLKNIFRPSKEKEEPVTPYVRQHGTHTPNNSSSSASHQIAQSIHTVSSDSQLSLSSQTYGDSLHSTESTFPTLSSQSQTGLPSSSSSSQSSSRSSSLSSSSLQSHSGFHKPSSRQNSSLSSSSSFVEHGSDDGGDGEGHGGGSGGVTDSTTHPTLTDSAEKKMLAQKYYQLSGSGWKKDWDGKWIRDEEAEFDSDEEAPDLP